MPLIQDNTNGMEGSKLSWSVLEPLLQSRDRIFTADDALPIKLQKTHQLLLYTMTMVSGEIDVSCEDIIGSGRITELSGLMYPACCGQTRYGNGKHACRFPGDSVSKLWPCPSTGRRLRQLFIYIPIP